MSGTAAPPLKKDRLLEADGIALDDVRCGSDRAGWSPAEETSSYGIVFVRRGCFRRLADGFEAFLDPASLYFERPGQVQQFAHPYDGGDTCTHIVLAEDVLASITGGEPHIPERLFYTTPEMDLEHRLLASSIRDTADGSALTERLVGLASSVLARSLPEQVAAGRPSTISARRKIVDDAREALADDPRLGLLQLARTVAVSPHHLSRIFRAETGETISRYRNRIRVRLALERLAEGDDRLARLARDLGFADQAHFSRVVSREVGSPPSWVRSALVERLR